MPAITEKPKSLLTRREAAEVLGCTTGTLAVWSHCKRGPAYHKVGRSVRYRLSDLERFLEQSRVTTREQT